MESDWPLSFRVTASCFGDITNRYSAAVPRIMREKGCAVIALRSHAVTLNTQPKETGYYFTYTGVGDHPRQGGSITAAADAPGGPILAGDH